MHFNLHETNFSLILIVVTGQANLNLSWPICWVNTEARNINISVRCCHYPAAKVTDKWGKRWDLADKWNSGEVIETVTFYWGVRAQPHYFFFLLHWGTFKVLTINISLKKIIRMISDILSPSPTWHSDWMLKFILFKNRISELTQGLKYKLKSSSYFYDLGNNSGLKVKCLFAYW